MYRGKKKNEGKCQNFTASDPNQFEYLYLLTD